MDKFLSIQFIKYILVGILNTVFGYAVFALLLYTGLHYALVCILSTIIGVLFNYKTYGKLVFNSKKNVLIKFVLTYVITTSLSILGLKIANSYNINLYFAGFILTCLMAIISFILLKNYVFKEQK